MATIYIQSFSKDIPDILQVTLESLIVLHVLKVCDNNKVNLRIVLKGDTTTTEPLFQLAASDISHDVINYNDVPFIAKYCSWPVAVVGRVVIAGLASVSRQIVKSCNDKNTIALLGFREACLMACNETSIWTKFCEIDMIATVKDMLKSVNNYIKSNMIQIPVDLTRFEVHMTQPVRIHNVYKLAREKNNDKLIKSNTPIEQLNLEHRYSEGPFMTLSDLLLFPCFKIAFSMFDETVLAAELPLSLLWYKNLCNDRKQPKINFNFSIAFEKPLKDAVVHQEEVVKQSLYSSDPKRYKPQCRIYTRQIDVDKALTIATDLSSVIIRNERPFGHEIDFSWENIPLEANPEGGALPSARATRKCQQLQNLAKAAIKISSNKNHVIVDFCSGSGHLGILVATLLPNSHIILVENKERSLQRALDRVAKLNLTNVSLVQSNLDYFVATFDVGMALHACGVATDLVIQTCIKNKAHFVCCPCCYGGIHNCHHLTYPRSIMFKDTSLSYKDYLTIGHSADQTHDENNTKTAQGYACMHLIDTDRKLQAEECGYEVHLGKLLPPSCTPKNNLLVGIHQ